MPISSGRSKIDYEKIEDEDRLNDLLENWKGMGMPSDLSIASDLVDCGVISDRSYIDYCSALSPRKTIRVQSQINPMQYMGMPYEYRDHIISDVKRKLAESISESISRQVSFREDVSYDGTITIVAELDIDRF